MRYLSGVLFCLYISLSPVLTSAQSGEDSVASLQNVPTLNQHPSSDSLMLQATVPDGSYALDIGDSTYVMRFTSGSSSWMYHTDHRGELVLLESGEQRASKRLYHISQRSDGSFRIQHLPLWLSILPPLIAIGLALIFQEVIVSLFAGIWAGAFIAGGLRIESIYYIFISFVEVVSEYLIRALSDTGHLSVIVFSLFIGGMVALISRNGGMAGVVQKLSAYAQTARSSQFVTWLLGIAIFFDDYANTLIVGSTMRSVTDRFRVSREKLAYIVDSTAAPIASVALITTWIGAELGYIDSGIQMLEGFNTNLTPYSIFLSSLKYSFYPVLTMLFIVMVIWMNRDYGPMHTAEQRAAETGQVSPARTDEEDEPDMENLSPVSNAPNLWHTAVIPVVIVILMTIAGLMMTGKQAVFQELSNMGMDISPTFGNVWNSMGPLLEGEASPLSKIGLMVGYSDSYLALLWASVSGVVAAVLLTVGHRIMNLFDAMHVMTTGFKTMMPAIIILCLAWSLAITTHQLHTASYLTFLLEGTINPYVIPMIIFVLSALIAFSTGSSWSTMAILYPIAIPTTWSICMVNDIPYDMSMELLYNVIAIVLAASVLGDHCSPISDTTILSSLASDCNHIDHVRTQLPYALTVGIVSLICAGLSTYLGGGWMISFSLVLISIIVLWSILRYFGKKVPHPV